MSPDIANSFPIIGALVQWAVMLSPGPFAQILLCWIITPGMMFAIGILGESRLLPWHKSEQFVSFLPGDLFLGVMAGGLLWSLRHIENPPVFWIFNLRSPIVQAAIFVLVVAVSGFMSLQDKKVYPRRAYFSPTKLGYHDTFVFMIYGYVCVMLILLNLFSGNWQAVATWGYSGLAWICLLWVDATDPVEIRQNRLIHAHVEDWRPFWVR